MKTWVAVLLALLLVTPARAGEIDGEKVLASAFFAAFAYTFNDRASVYKSDAERGYSSAMYLLHDDNPDNDVHYSNIVNSAAMKSRKAERYRLVAGGLVLVSAIFITVGVLEVGYREDHIEVKKTFRF